jgi:hypothetical protein
MDPTSLPNYHLRLKFEAIIILVRNILVQDGLINGTRLIVKEVRRSKAVKTCLFPLETGPLI